MNLSVKAEQTNLITIGDLKDNYFDKLPISSDQIQALKWFDKYRVGVLKKANGTADFQEQYLALQIIENTMDYRVFLKDLKI